MTGPREAEELAGEIAVDFYDAFWARTRFRFGDPPADYELLGSEALGSDDPYLTVLRRKSDGQLFEIQAEVTVLAVDMPAAAEEIPGQQTLLDVAS